ncbi:hypothetical protein OG444_12465 [Streptomyces sp. NBC_01232]|uniref:hypothetical protein n=1 Tax=Streptomyces sp. NBC_01232 TaxID=2903786 RepID=UPI002E0DF435|nr:hypothetical protein OG444_12465 [Streptomyces sp. NBC_01232]
MAHTLPAAGSVGWTMTRASLGRIFNRQTTDMDVPVPPGGAHMGKWTFTPASPDRAQGENATLHHEGREIELNYSASVVEDFLKEISAIHREFDLRSRAVAASGTCPDDQVRHDSRV